MTVWLSEQGAACEMDKIEDLINDLFQLDSYSPPNLLVTGNFRPALHAAFANQLMYYQERSGARFMKLEGGELIEQQGEMNLVSVRMHEAFFEKYSKHVSAHQKFIEWGTLIRHQFTQDNLHLTSRATMSCSHCRASRNSSMDSLVELLQQQGSALSTIASRLTHLEDEMRHLRDEQTRARDEQTRALVAGLDGYLQTLNLQEPQRAENTTRITPQIARAPNSVPQSASVVPRHSSAQPPSLVVPRHSSALLSPFQPQASPAGVRDASIEVGF